MLRPAFVTDPNLNTSTFVISGFADSGATAALNVHGSIVSHVTFSGTPGQPDFAIQALDADLALVNGVPTAYQEGTGAPAGSQFNSLWQWSLGTSSINNSASPSLISLFPGIAGDNISGTFNDLARESNGNYVCTIDRSAGTDTASVVVLNSSGQKLWDSWTATNQLGGSPSANTIADALRNTYSVAISPDGKTMALGVIGPNPAVYVVPLDSNGIPILSEARLVVVGSTADGRDVAFDAAGNIVLAASGDAAAYEISPGGLSQTVYSNNATNTAGTFTSTQLSPTWDQRRFRQFL